MTKKEKKRKKEKNEQVSSPETEANKPKNKKKKRQHGEIDQEQSSPFSNLPLHSLSLPQPTTVSILWLLISLLLIATSQPVHQSLEF